MLAGPGRLGRLANALSRFLVFLACVSDLEFEDAHQLFIVAEIAENASPLVEGPGGFMWDLLLPVSSDSCSGLSSLSEPADSEDT